MSPLEGKRPHQVWSLAVGGHTHTLSVWGSLRRRFEWQVDAVTVANHASADDRTELKAEGHGRIKVRFSSMGAPRRATLFEASEADSAQAIIGVGGTDMVPAAGSPAAKYERRLLDHPKLYPMLEAFGSVGGIIAGVAASALIAWLVSQIDWPTIPWPDIDLPNIPWPSIPWPDFDLPDIPWPDVTLPGWLSWLVDHLKYIVPVVIAYLLGRREVRRRQRRDHQAGQESTD